MFNHILVPLDGSDLAESVLPMVESLGRQLKSKVTVLRVVDVNAITRSMLPATPDGGGYSGDMQKIIDETIAAEVKEARDYLDSVVKRLAGVDIAAEVREGVPDEEIMNAIETEGVDVAAIATHGRSGLGRTIFGSVADHLIRESGKPIIVVKPKRD